jgi:hypothetical protein
MEQTVNVILQQGVEGTSDGRSEVAGGTFVGVGLPECGQQLTWYTTPPPEMEHNVKVIFEQGLEGRSGRE